MRDSDGQRLGPVHVAPGKSLPTRPTHTLARKREAKRRGDAGKDRWGGGRGDGVQSGGEQALVGGQKGR